jgi:hypothetical protein
MAGFIGYPNRQVLAVLARLRRVLQFSLMDQLPAMAWYEAALREEFARWRGPEPRVPDLMKH